MSSQTKETSFESYIATILTECSGWTPGSNADWDVDRALFPAQVLAFLQETQPKAWKEMKALHGAGLKPLILNTLIKELDLKGMLHVLRHGFKFYGKTFRHGVLQARPRAERRSAGALRKEPAHGHAPGAMPSGQARYGRSCCSP